MKVTDRDREAAKRFVYDYNVRDIFGSRPAPIEDLADQFAQAREEGRREERESVELCGALGLRVLSWLVDDNWGNSLDACDVCEMALKSGLLERVTYDPATHGEIEEAEPGEEVWILTKAAIRARGED